MIKVVSWNLAQRADAWRALLQTGADLALVQEAAAPPPDVADQMTVDDSPWLTERASESCKWRTAVVRLNRELDVTWCTLRPLCSATISDIGVSRPGTLAAAVVRGAGLAEPITLVSMYGAWEVPLQASKSDWIYADASVHRLISDLSTLIGHQKGHRVIAAGDLNILHGYGEYGSSYWAARYKTVFERMEALGLPFVGPQHPNGRQAEPWPEELPKGSANVPTYHTNRQTPATAARQLDFVFASRDLAKQTSVRALNEVETWGPSDHCKIEIELS
ncbi:MAG TPA: endonuclease/exonuclease/phosphatase family protein [Polyangiaceae bacterium]